MRLKSCKFLLTALHYRHETSHFVAVVGWVFDQFHCTIHHVNMYPQYWTPSMGVFLCDTVMSTKRSVLNCTDILQKIHAGRVAAAYRMCYDEVQNFKRSDEF